MHYKGSPTRWKGCSRMGVWWGVMRGAHKKAELGQRSSTAGPCQSDDPLVTSSNQNPSWSAARFGSAAVASRVCDRPRFVVAHGTPFRVPSSPSPSALSFRRFMAFPLCVFVSFLVHFYTSIRFGFAVFSCASEHFKKAIRCVPSSTKHFCCCRLFVELLYCQQLMRLPHSGWWIRERHLKQPSPYPYLHPLPTTIELWCVDTPTCRANLSKASKQRVGIHRNRC